MSSERGIAVQFLGRRGLYARVNVNVFTRGLCEDRSRAAHSHHQKYYEGDTSRELFAGQHRPYKIRALNGGDPHRPERRAPISSMSRIVAQSRKSIGLFRTRALDSASDPRVGSPTCASFFSLYMYCWIFIAGPVGRCSGFAHCPTTSLLQFCVPFYGNHFPISSLAL